MKLYIKSSDDLWDYDEMLKHGKDLYDSYGPDVDTYDMDEYDAECYLTYKRSI